MAKSSKSKQALQNKRAAKKVKPPTITKTLLEVLQKPGIMLGSLQKGCFQREDGSVYEIIIPQPALTGVLVRKIDGQREVTVTALPTGERVIAIDPPALIGGFGGYCNRTACRRMKATDYNVVNQAYYCGSCARKINEGTPEYTRDNPSMMVIRQDHEKHPHYSSVRLASADV